MREPAWPKSAWVQVANLSTVAAKNPGDKRDGFTQSMPVRSDFKTVRLVRSTPSSAGFSFGISRLAGCR